MPVLLLGPGPAALALAPVPATNAITARSNNSFRTTKPPLLPFCSDSTVRYKLCNVPQGSSRFCPHPATAESPADGDERWHGPLQGEQACASFGRSLTQGDQVTRKRHK